jgi:hypothetical protein
MPGKMGLVSLGGNFLISLGKTIKLLTFLKKKFFKRVFKD